MSKKDEILAEGKWQFDKDVTDCFDDMLSRSIPDYNTMRDLTLRLSESFVKNNLTLLDLGCSNGINLDMFMRRYAKQLGGRYVGVDASKTMIDNARTRLSGYSKDCRVELYNSDATRFSFGNREYDIVTSILTIQFIPVEKRPSLLGDVYRTLRGDGVFLMVEKILQPVPVYDELFVDRYYSIKRDNGYSEEQIRAKKVALENVLVPNTHSGNIELLKGAGFKYVDTFWKCLNFEGYIAIKEE